MWGAQLEGSAKTLLAGSSAAPQSAVEEAEGFLLELLSAGVVPSTEVWTAGEQAGHSRKTLQRAARNLKVKCKPRDGKWEMSLPAVDADLGDDDGDFPEAD